VGTEIIAFRTPEGIKRERDLSPMGDRPEGISYHTSLIMLSDHAGAQLDGLSHATTGLDNHWYNGFTVSEHGSDFGPRKAGAENIPPIIAPAVLIDVAGYLGVEELEPSQPISSRELEDTLKAQESHVEPGDVVMVRTGTMRHWSEGGHAVEALSNADSAGITLEAARWLVEDQGAMLVGGDTSTLEVVPAVDGESLAPVHEYLLIDQGVHMGELHNLEGLARDSVYEFTYIALCPPVKGTTAGFALRPIAIV
jgi:kynurenine formamidase